MKTKESWGRVSIRNFSFLSDFQSTAWTCTCSYVSLQLQTKIVMYKSRKLKCQQRQVSLLNLALIYLLLSIYSRDSGGMKCLGHSRNVYAWWIREEKAGTKYDLFTGLDVSHTTKTIHLRIHWFCSYQNNWEAVTIWTFLRCLTCYPDLWWGIQTQGYRLCNQLEGSWESHAVLFSLIKGMFLFTGQ